MSGGGITVVFGLIRGYSFACAEIRCRAATSRATTIPLAKVKIRTTKLEYERSSAVHYNLAGVHSTSARDSRGPATMIWRVLDMHRDYDCHCNVARCRTQTDVQTSVMTAPYEDLSAALDLLDAALVPGVAGHNGDVPGKGVEKEATDPHLKLGADANRYKHTRVGRQG